MKLEIPRIFNDVREFTGDFLDLKKPSGLYLSSEVYLFQSGDFLEKLRKVGTDLGDEGTRGFIDFTDGNIYLNFEALAEKMYREQTFSVITRFQPYAFVLEETPYGKWVREETKKSLKSGTLTPQKLEYLSSNLLDGICRTVELDAVDKVKGYDLGLLKTDILKSLEKSNDEVREGIKLYRNLQKKAKECTDDIDEMLREQIVRAVLLVAGRDKNFDGNYKDLSSAEVYQIYQEAGYKILNPIESVDEVVRQINEIKGNLVGGQTKHVIPELENLSRRLKVDIGAPIEMREKINENIENIKNDSETHPNIPIPKRYHEPTDVLLDEVKSYLDNIKKRKRKIFK